MQVDSFYIRYVRVSNSTQFSLFQLLTYQVLFTHVEVAEMQLTFIRNLLFRSSFLLLCKQLHKHAIVIKHDHLYYSYSHTFLSVSGTSSAVCCRMQSPYETPRPLCCDLPINELPCSSKTIQSNQEMLPSMKAPGVLGITLPGYASLLQSLEYFM